MKFPSIKRPAFTRNNVIKYLSLTAIAAGGIAIISLLSSGPAVRAAFVEFPEGQKRAISFDIAGETLDTMSGRKRLDQMRDWLLFTAVSDAGLSAEEFNQSLFDLPAVRHGYLQPTANFEYGETRSAYIGEGRIVALVPADGDPKRRADRLGHIADLHRKNTGETPQSLTVFEYAIALDDDEPTGELTRRETIDAREFFSPKYHYVESTITSLDDLRHFLNWVDDLVFARADGLVLTLGGRKLQGETYRGIGVEEIAAIWQSETGRATDGSGFSLDPAYDYTGLKNMFDSRMAQLCESRIGPAQTAKVSRALGEKQVGPLFDALYAISKTDPVKAKELEQDVIFGYQFQAARYDGKLKGTESGMVLFYTDLMAKLWMEDFLNSAPSADIDGFKPAPAIDVSPIFEKELEDLSQTRVWFGPQDRGFQVADEGRNLLFSHVATRIYAASANSLQPGEESEPNAESAAFLGWWDDHYEEVARFEPQYQRLNQIMKWSLLSGWMNRPDRGTHLNFLNGVTVKRDLWFPEWARQNTALRFRAWGDECKPGPKVRNAWLAPKVCFYERGYHGTETEAMPRLASRPYRRFSKIVALIGGVSLGTNRTIEIRPPVSTQTEVPARSLRSYINLNGASREGFQTLDGARIEFKSASSRDSSSMTAVPKDGAHLRDHFLEVSGTAMVERTINNNSAGLQVTTQANGTEIGALRITQSQNGFKVGYASREMDAGHALGRTISRKGQFDLEAIRKDPRVAAAERIPNEEAYLVKLRDSNRLLKMAEEKVSTTRLEAGWDSRVASLNGRKRILLRWVTEAEAKLAMGGSPPPTVPPPLGPGGPLLNALRRGDLRGATEQLLRAHAITEVRFKLHFENGINEANSLIAQGKFPEAIRSLNDLAAIHGSRPEINTLRGLAKLSEQSLRVAQAVTETKVASGARNTTDFFNKVNVRLARGGLPNEGNLKLITDGNRVGLRYDIASLTGKPATPAELHGRNVTVLVQDSPGLNNLNWSVNPERAAREAVSLGIGDLRRAAVGDLASFRPSQVFVGEVRTSTTTTSNSSTLYRPHYSFNSSNDPCAYLPEEEKLKCLAATRGTEVYVVTATEKGKIER